MAKLTNNEDSNWNDRLSQPIDNDTSSRFGTQNLNEGSRFGSEDISKSTGTKEEFFTLNHIDKKDL